MPSCYYEAKSNSLERKEHFRQTLILCKPMSFGATAADYGLGNNGVKVSLNYFDGIIDQSLIAALCSVELQLVFKLLLKRDETTKDKALSELLQLMNRDESIIRDDCFALCWSQLYAKLAYIQ